MYSTKHHRADSYGGGVVESSSSSNDEQLTKEEREFENVLDKLSINAGGNIRRPMVKKMARSSSGHLNYKCIPCGIFCTGVFAMKDHLYSGIHKSSQLQLKECYQENYSEEECDARLKQYKSIPCIIQSTLDNSTEPLVGVEYIVEISHGWSESPDYYCALCLKWFKKNNILKHLIDLAHNFTYVQRHYSKAYFLYLEQTNLDLCLKYKTKIIKVMVKFIASTYGRQKPLRIVASEFAFNREIICKWIHGSHHYNDSNGRTFEELIVKSITELVRSGHDKDEDNEEQNRSAASYPSIIEKKMSLAERQKMALELVKRIEAKTKETFHNYKLNPEKHPLYSEEWKIFWNKRYKELKTEGKDYKSYDYKSEWIIYWKVRTKELYEEELKLAKKKIHHKLSLSLPKEVDDSPTSSDKSDLRLLINKFRAKDKRKSAESRRSSDRHRSPDRRKFKQKRLSSDRRRRTEDRSSPHKKKRRIRSRERSRSPYRGRATKSRRSNERRNSRGRLSLMDGRRATPTKRLRSETRSSSYSINSSPRILDSGWLLSMTDDMNHETVNKGNKHENVNIYSFNSDSDDSLDSLHDVNASALERSSVGNARSSSRNTNNSSVCSNVHILPILRLLVALEDHLGSLGPKVVDLLTEALKMEKEKANSSEDLLGHEPCLTLLETIKEKLKGASQAGLVSAEAAAAVRTAIVRTTSLLHEADRRAAINNNPVETEKKQVVEVEEVKKENNSDPSTPEQEMDISYISSEPEEAVMPHPMGELSNTDLVMLLYNFAKLTEEEQDGLIGYFKILETQDPRRISRLRNLPPPAPTKPPSQKRARKKVSRPLTQNPTPQDLNKSPINVANLLATVRASVEPSTVNTQLASAPTATASAILDDTYTILKPQSDAVSHGYNSMPTALQMNSNVPIIVPNFKNSNFPPQNEYYNWNPTQDIPVKRQFPFEEQPTIPSKIAMGASWKQQPALNNFPKSQWVQNSQPQYYENNANNYFPPNNNSGNLWEVQPGNMPNQSYGFPNSGQRNPKPQNLPTFGRFTRGGYKRGNNYFRGK